MSWISSLCFVWAVSLANGDFNESFRLSGDVTPSHYDLSLLYDLDPLSFSYFGVVDILLTAKEPTSRITLHAKYISIEKEKVSLNVMGSQIRGEAGEKNDITNVAINDKYDFVTLDLSRAMVKDEVYSLIIPFHGNLSDDIEGVYRTSYTNEITKDLEYVLLTLFEPNSARKGFPCFDEPGFKAKFTIAIGHQMDYHAISNMPLRETSNTSVFDDYWSWNDVNMKFAKNKTDFVWDHFETSVVMSTYLVAFVVSKFQHVVCPGDSKTMMRVWARPDVIAQTSIVAKIIPKILSYYENLFKIPYSLPKLDHVAIPDASVAGAENWGIIFYQEMYFLHDETETSPNEFTVTLITHEVAHQWFGNLVTMKWWNNLWLKEGFATFMEPLASEAVLQKKYSNFPPVDEMFEVLRFDALQSSHPVMLPIDDSNDIARFYNAISYGKSFLLIRMLYLSLGEETFMEAIRGYLFKNSHNSTDHDDLWEELSNVSIEHGLRTRTTVKRVMDTWITQPGYPMLTVKRDYTTNSLTVTQSRYLTLERSDAARRSPPPSWWVPLRVRAQRDNPLAQPPVQWLADDEGSAVAHRFQHTAATNEWLLFNIDFTAFCRINYDNLNWHLLTDALKTDHKTIPSLSRAQLLGDAFELAWTGNLNYDLALEMASYLSLERDVQPLFMGMEALKHISLLLKRTSDYTVYKKYVHSLIRDTYHKVELKMKKRILREDDHFNKKMQTTTSRYACETNLPECEDNAIALFKKWMDSNDLKKNPIPEHLRRVIYCVAVRRGNEEHWRHLLLQVQRSPSDEDAVAALGCCTDVALIYRTLEMVITTGSPLPQVHSQLVFLSVIDNPVGFYVAKDFIYHRASEVLAKFAKGVFDVNPVELLIKQFYSQEELDVFFVWHDKHAALMKDYEVNIKRAVEAARINIAWIAKYRRLVVDKLKKIVKYDDLTSLKERARTRSNASTTVFTNVLLYFMYLFGRITL